MTTYKKHRFLITTTVILAIVGGVLSTWIVDKIRHEAKEQVRTHIIITNAESLLSSLKDAETGQRGFLLTKNKAFLKPYEIATQELEGQYKELISLTKNQNLKSMLVELKPLIDERLRLLDRTIQLELQGNSSRALQIVSTGDGKEYMDRIRQLMETFKARELELLKIRGMRFEATVTKLTLAITATFSFAIFFTIAVFSKIKRLKEDAEDKLSFRNALFNSADIAIFGTDKNLTITSINSQAERMFNLNSAEVLNRYSLKYIFEYIKHVNLQSDNTSIDLANSDSLVHLIQGPADRYKFEGMLLGDSIGERTLACSITKSKDSSGNFIGYLLVADDITETRSAQMALHDSELRYKLTSEHLKKIIDSSIDMICTIDAKGRFIEVGAASKDILGYRPEDLIGKPYMDFVHPEDVSKTKKIGLEITQGKSTRDFQNRYLKKDGTEVHMMWSAIWSETDGLLYAVARDMTTSIRVSEELKSYEELMNLAGDISNIGGWTIDLDTKKFFWTRQVYKILEFPEGSPPSWNQRLKLYTPESRIAFLDAVKNCKMHGKSFDLKLETKTKKSRWINTRLIGNPIRNNEGKVVRLAGAIQDITAQTMQEKNLIAAKEAAISANAAKDVFLSTMSHEIRTPLNGLLGMLELLSFTKLETEQRENLKVALDSGRNLIRIINDLLDHAKIEAGKLQFVNEPNSINELITRLELSYIPIASSKNISLTKYVDSALSPFHVFDSLRLTQILGNLISNAIKFTDNGNVKIVASLISRSADEEKIALRVTDSGIGISEDAKTRLFTPFEQASSDTARMYGGTGLGLSICRKLAEMMGGYIELESELSKGSTFTVFVTFPIAEAPEHPALQIQSSTLDDFERSGKILVVDDHPVNRKLLSRQLAQLDISADLAENGEQAFEKFKKGDYSLIITDCNMPVMDGYELARTIREYELFHNLVRIPIIAWTANALSDARDAVFKVGMDDILIKPSEIGFIKSKLSTWLPLKKTNRTTSEAKVFALKQNFPFDLTSVTENFDEQLEIVEEYCLQTRKDLEAAQKAISQNAPENLQRIAHQIKGASRLIHARSLVLLSQELEESLKGTQNWLDANDLVTQIANQINQLEDFINTLRSEKTDRIKES